MTEANFSNKNLRAGGAIIISSWISNKDDKGALSVANVMGNNIGKDQLTNLQEIMRSKPNLVSLCGIADDAIEADLSGLGMDADDAAILASELPDKGALSSLNLSSNTIGARWDGAQQKWVATPEGEHANHLSHPSCSHCIPYVGPAAIADAIKDNGALSSANLLGNRIGIGQAKALASILKEHSTLKSLCGNRGDETELDMSGKKIGVEGAIMLSPEIIDNGALSVLSLKSNNLRAGGGKALADGLKGNQVITELNISDNNLGNSGYDMSGITALAGVIPDMGALIKLDISSNDIPSEQDGGLQRLCTASGIDLVL
jgi:Ran GTPase-activating protein (RanGAP) involved in mRNA processing and transport